VRASFCLVLLFACDGAADPIDAGRDAGMLDAGSERDAGRDAAIAGPDICDELELPRAPFSTSGSGTTFDDIAGDFTVETTDGPFTLSEAWTGCESYVFINYANTDYGNELFDTYLDPLFLDGPRNVHYFFTSYEDSSAAARSRVMPLVTQLEDAFEYEEMPEEEREFWRARIHFVVEPIADAEGLGSFVRARTTVEHTFAIMRDQRWDPVGSLFEVRAGGFVPRIGMAAWAGHYYNYRAELSARLAAEDATIVPLIDERDVTARFLDRDATLPDAAAMAAFDTFEIDLEIHCRLTPDQCSEWDRNAYVHLCLDDTCADKRELVRWITPYSRPGRMRWVMDASPLLGLISEGGARRFRIETGPEWEEATRYDITASIRLSTRDVDRSARAELAFRGGEFNDAYNAAHAPFRFTPPAGTRRVELAVIVSGHGQIAGNNCAEWCNHEHSFRVNMASEDRHISFPGQSGQAQGCAERSAEGVVPGQWGNWAPLRAGWCPGLPVPVARFDVTDEVTLGAENELTYEGSFNGGPPAGGTIDLSAYVVYYE
jgi:hypothetical protein